MTSEAASGTPRVAPNVAAVNIAVQ